MQINGIEYCISLFFNDDSGEIKELNFKDFDEVNEYIKVNSADGYSVSFSFCEMINGIPDLPSWEKEMQWVEFSQEDIQFEIEGHLQFLEESKKLTDATEEIAKEFHYCQTTYDYDKKKAWLHEFAYVCPRCMYELEHCRCKNYPDYLIQIDKQILPIVRELNINGYVTTYCCAGHPSADRPMDIYIAFDREYRFDLPFPDGGRYSKQDHILRYTPPKDMPKEEYGNYQKCIMEELFDWAEMLLPTEEISQ